MPSQAPSYPLALAFAPALARPLIFSQPRIQTLLPPRHVSRRARRVCMAAGTNEDTSNSTSTSTSTSVNSMPATIADISDSDYSLDTDALKERAMQVVSDVSERPLYYSKIIAYAFGALVSLTVLRAIVSAVDSIPILPGALELIGLSYTVWFVWRYVLFKESRQELIDEIEEFLGRARPQ